MQDRFDITMTNTTRGLLVKCKHLVIKENVVKLSESKVKTLKKLYPDFRDLEMYLAVAGASFDLDAEQDEKQSGIIILKKVGELMEEEATHAGNIATPAGNIATPAGNDATPAGNDATHAGNAVTPAGNAVTPAGNAVTHAGNAVTPAGNAVTPAGNAVTPAGDAVTPAGNAVTPAGDATKEVILP
ncbi:hypothetical protein CHS0354_024000 [Potamilus streckersoni]|uniref:Uncharacterized protein n=1 Tax=Potamilus streckersoni TaxID=2493646 RepID=A0AAE0RZT0_9BIVA|nr:hypothetical protein CHS0354_024000 [Potamilus streckersoni]